MCPCFNVKDELSELLKEDEPEINEEPEESTESIQESEEVVLEEPVVESGEVVVPGEEKPVQSGDTSRPNPLYFVWEFVKLLFKIILRKK